MTPLRQAMITAMQMHGFSPRTHVPVHRLQRLLGHKSLSSTVRYVHWLPDPDECEGEHDLVGRLEKRQ